MVLTHSDENRTKFPSQRTKRKSSTTSEGFPENKQNGAWKPPEYQQGRHLYLPCRCCWCWAAYSHTSSPSCDGWPWPLHQRLTDDQLSRTNTSVRWRMHTFHIKVGAHLKSRWVCGRQGNGWGGWVRTRGQGSRSMKRCTWERKRRERRRSGKLSRFLHQLNWSTEKSGWNGHKKRGRWFKSRPRRGAWVRKSRKVEKNSLKLKCESWSTAVVQWGVTGGRARNILH